MTQKQISFSGNIYEGLNQLYVWATNRMRCGCMTICAYKQLIWYLSLFIC